MSRAPSIRGNVLPLLLIGTGTVLGTMALIVLWMTLTEGTQDWATVGVYAALAAGSIILFAVIPSFVVWYLAAQVVARSGLSPRWMPAVACAVTAIVGSVVITVAFAAFDSSIVGLYAVGIAAALSGMSGSVAVVLTLLLFPRAEAPV